ncbi:hypothetical protein [Bartonella tribocorum]|uniref:Uncharacterized protein n=1 Tax=Bartonella tribocorum TaxID=85701 RepID=A0A2N9Y856_9HYPH|nr:hypothetical protein [Bartonella tribocorum]PIT67889.1 hypothetical protein CER18_09225 [Bartonella tribocorum]
MSLKPFAVSELSDPSQVRVVLYTGSGFVHAPLNSLVSLLKDSLNKDHEESLKALKSEIEELQSCLF